ncbi:carbonic anhydrase, partial [Clostridium sp. HCS.1]
IIDIGIPIDTIETLENGGIDINKSLHGFDSVEKSIEDSVNLIKKHPLIPKDILGHGLVIDPETGKLELVFNGYK